eukprot:CAMPEP_0177618174 /NCGR_PEP_ID=MMETSP0419_2-20121207/25386_1 /TAXON_ID=582737 /ORGANISM="Tetraselmis sp., Strain GSL018" /LENGTH=118 /DNA_ID=CAMNT_0019116957 /DNA_START=956 /DNA_END=1313 /DNA_ORIENTATION=-
MCSPFLENVTADDALLNPRATYAIAFSIYDKDGSGFICKEEVKDFLFEVMRENSKLHFTDEELDTVIEQTFQEVDLARDNKIHPAEWRSFCIGNPAAINYMTLPVLRDLTARFPEAFR